jgi:RNA polymerase sigma-70 factor (ECF subfamily)
MNFETLYRLHFATVHRFALYLCGDPAEADDIASETFVRAWAADAPIRARSLEAYLFTVARNLHRRGFRQRRQKDALASRPIERSGDLERELAGRSELRALLERLQTLAEPDRAALLMRAFHGLSYEEIGAALGTSAAAAKVRVHRTRARLGASTRASLAAEGEENDDRP